jgi:hypothetical protein
MSLKCFYCNENININDFYELKYIFPKLRGNLFLINVCQSCTDTICVYKNFGIQNEYRYEYMKINNNMEKIKIHNYLGSISGINIFKDFKKMAEWISQRKIGDDVYQWLIDNNYLVG